MTAETAIRRLSFAEARGSAAEAMVMMARHRAELDQAQSRGKSEAAQTAQFVDRTRDARADAPHIDKTA